MTDGPSVAPVITEPAFQRLHARLLSSRVAVFGGREFGSKALRCDPVGWRSSPLRIAGRGSIVVDPFQVFVAL